MSLLHSTKLFEKPTLPDDLEPIPAGMTLDEMGDRWRAAAIGPGDCDSVRDGDPRLSVGPRWILHELPELRDPAASPMLDYWFDRMGVPRSPVVAKLAAFALGVLLGLIPVLGHQGKQGALYGAAAAIVPVISLVVWGTGSSRRVPWEGFRFRLWRRPIRFRFANDPVVLMEHLLAPATEREHLIGILATSAMSRTGMLWLESVLLAFGGATAAFLVLAFMRDGGDGMKALLVVALLVAACRAFFRGWLRGQTAIMGAMRVVQAVNYYIFSAMGTKAYLWYLVGTLASAGTVVGIFVGFAILGVAIGGLLLMVGVGVWFPDASPYIYAALVAFLLLFPHTPLAYPMQRFARMNSRIMIEQAERALRNWRRICLHSLAEESKAPRLYIR